VGRLDVLAAGQVGDGEIRLEDTVVSARRKLQLVHGRAHQNFAGFVQLAKLAYLRLALNGILFIG